MYPDSIAGQVVTATSATERLVAMLNDPSEEPITLTRTQLAYLMASAQRWGYEARAAEEDQQWTLDREQTVQVLGRWYDQVGYRRECDRQARTARPNDHPGGPVAWGETTTEMAA